MRDASREGRGRVALVTGASSGIGRATSELLAAKGYDVVVLARRTARLEELAAELRARHDVHATVLTADLSDPAAPSSVVEQLRAQGVVVDFLVNNAGYSRIGRYGDTEWAEHERRVRVVGLAPLEHESVMSLRCHFRWLATWRTYLLRDDAQWPSFSTADRRLAIG